MFQNQLKIFLLFLIFLTNKFACQSDFKPKNTNHSFGFDLGYPLTSEIMKYRFDANANYIFNYYYFTFRTQSGVTPFTNFGTVSKIFFSAGFTTKTSHNLSWYLTYGGGMAIPSKKTYYDSGRNRTYVYRVETHQLLCTGFNILPFHDKSIVLGVNTNIFEEEYDSKSRQSSYNLVLRINLSINKTINYGKK